VIGQNPSPSSPLAVFLRLREHQVWLQHRLLDVAEPLSDAELQQAFPIGQGSVWQSLNHLHMADHVWLAAVEGEPAPAAPPPIPLCSSDAADSPANCGIPRLREQWTQLDEAWRECLNDLTPADLDRVVFKTSSYSGPSHAVGTPLPDVLMHVPLHANYTAAQIVNMLRQLGVSDLPDAMMISFSRRQHPNLKRPLSGP